MTRHTVRFTLVLLGGLVAAPAPAQVKYPELKPDERIDVQIWYRIRGDRDERISQFRELTAYLRKIEFAPAPRENDQFDILDPTAERFFGTIPWGNRLRIFDDPRVRMIQFGPVGFDDKVRTQGKPVPVRLRLANPPRPSDQRLLHEQVLAQLHKMGFREALRYDTAGFTLIRGDIPIEHYPRLMKDLRREPSGWLYPDTPPDLLPAPLRDMLPIRWVQVLPDDHINYWTDPVVPDKLKQYTSTPPRDPLVVYTPDFRELYAKQGPEQVRVEVLLEGEPNLEQMEQIRIRLRTQYQAMGKDDETGQQLLLTPSLDGVVGHVVTIRFPNVEVAASFAVEPGVVGIRLPRPAVETAGLRTGQPPSPEEILKSTNLARLHQLGYRGRGTRVVIIATEFPGLRRWFGVPVMGGDRPFPVVYIDLTTEVSPLFDPYPSVLTPGAPEGPYAHPGTATAMAAHLAAPEAQFTLVRVDPAAMFQVFNVARSVRGVPGYSEAMQSRVVELTNRGEELRRLYARAVDEYREAFRDLSDEKPAKDRRDRARENLLRLREAQQRLTERIGRFESLQKGVEGLAGADIVVNTLVWEAGFPLDGLSTVSQLIDMQFAGEAEPTLVTRSATRPRYYPKPLWVQAASGSVGSVWGGRFVDADSNGVLECSPPRPEKGFPAVAGAPLSVLGDPPGGWTRELNFINVLAPDGKVLQSSIAGARVRLSVQWREPHDPVINFGRESLRPITIRVFRQFDPTGTKRATDDLEEVGRTSAVPNEVRVTPTYGIYEQTVDFTMQGEGRYAVQIERGTEWETTLPALQRHIEIRPRMVLQFLDPAIKGRPVFETYAPRNVGVGAPGDVKSALTVGVGRPEDGLTTGGTGLAILTKPDLYGDPAIDFGTGQAGPAIAAGFMAGVAASAHGTGIELRNLLTWPRPSPGVPVVLSERWLNALRNLPGPK